MKDPHLIKQTVKHQQAKQAAQGKGPELKWWQLSLIGIGSIIGAGFFLGTGLSIKTAGPSVLLGYMIAGLTTFFVFSALAEMTVNDPQAGSFRTYARKAYGHPISFMSGWMYWLAGIFIMSSEVVALATFTQFWFPYIPLWVFSIMYSGLGIGINLLGVKNFGKIESIFAIIKLSTLIAFVCFGLLFVFGVVNPKDAAGTASVAFGALFPNGVIGLWSALIFVFFSFGGIAVIGVVSSELENKNEIPKAGFGLTIPLVSIYLAALLLIFLMVDWTTVNESESPFVTALAAFQIPYIDSIFNAIIISAAFSTMVGALFSVSHVMISLAQDGDAPKGLQEKNSRGIAFKSLSLTALGLCISIFFSYLLPSNMYEYITTSAGVMLILNWIIILASHIKLHPTYQNKTSFKAFGYPFTSYLGIGFILLALSGAMIHTSERIGLFISVGLLFVIFLCYKIIFQVRKQ
ncbi:MULTISPECIES: amino acid permease, partial [unclassified Bacillus (in: firmicutes)]|uniref:amino acid permease n=1 Tax=unclassified Bacillus (in: firmicutes) TaxID=185979 RepID=UPI00054D2646